MTLVRGGEADIAHPLSGIHLAQVRQVGGASAHSGCSRKCSTSSAAGPAEKPSPGGCSFRAMACCAMNRCYVLDAVRAELGDAAADALAASMAQQDEPAAIEGFSHFVTSMTAPIASGWSGCRMGFAPTGRRRLCTAHANSGRRRLFRKHRAASRMRWSPPRFLKRICACFDGGQSGGLPASDVAHLGLNPMWQQSEALLHAIAREVVAYVALDCFCG